MRSIHEEDRGDFMLFWKQQLFLPCLLCPWQVCDFDLKAGFSSSRDLFWNLLLEI